MTTPHFCVFYNQTCLLELGRIKTMKRSLFYLSLLGLTMLLSCEKEQKKEDHEISLFDYKSTKEITEGRRKG